MKAVRLFRRSSAPRERLSDEVLLYAGADGALRTIDEEGTITSVGGGPGGSVALDDLTDVDLTGASDDDVLTKSGAGWVAAPPSPGGSSPVLVATKNINNAQIKALRQTPIELVAAPGEGFALVPLHAAARLTWVADYGGIDADSQIRINLGSFQGILGGLDQTAFGVSNLLANGEAVTAWFPMRVGTASSFSTGFADFFDGDIEDKNLSISAANAADFTDGDAGNSLKVTILYYVVTF